MAEIGVYCAVCEALDVFFPRLVNAEHHPRTTINVSVSLDQSRF
jgi:hypothetical protein